ncbi:MAG: hypothetical protein DWI12_00650 [Planctomycetota bacterium]|nr:MAG: hypothetical protein DWI12_00650 [Planctomycetota bacterium]
MTRTHSMLLSLALFLSCVLGLTATRASAQQEIDAQGRGSMTVQQCMQSLLAYGRWYPNPDYGWVWQPHDVQPWWQPFSVGEWIVTQDGSPYWRSGYPHGWATEHYGSWFYDQSRGWMWVPGNDWSPAPVSWRGRDGVVGWAPQLATPPKRNPTVTSACEQPAFAWIFVATNRLMVTSNFVAAEQDLLARDVHGTWSPSAHDSDGVLSARYPQARNANFFDATQCLGAADAKIAFGAAVKARGGTLQGPPITFVRSVRQMGSGRVQNARLPVYAPTFTGSPQAVSNTFLVNPPAQRIQRAQPIPRAQPVARNAPVQRAQPAQPVERAQPVQRALPTAPAAPATPLAPYEAYTYQHESLDRYHSDQYEQLRNQEDQDATVPPYPGFDMSQLPAWQQREMREQQANAARNRALLDARQAEHLKESESGGNAATAPASTTTPAPTTPPPTTPPATTPPATTPPATTPAP